MSGYEIIVSKETWDQKLEPYRKQVYQTKKAGHFLRNRLVANEFVELDTISFLQELINTKRPQIFAESAVAGNGSDWNQVELSILGDVSIATPVTIFDNGRHHHPDVLDPPFRGTLLFTPGALLKNGRGVTPCDFGAVTSNGQLDSEKYFKLYERRLLPALQYANRVSRANNKKALITIPGLGCGVFAGKFKGQLSERLNHTLRRILEKHGGSLNDIQAVYFDPYSSCANERYEIGEISYRVRPLLQGNEQKPQLCYPTAYEEAGDDFSNCEFFSFVAWDHVSWPGNDFYIGSRATDDGVKGAATDVMQVMTGLEGYYSPVKNKYLQPIGFKNWDDVIGKYELEIRLSSSNLFVV
ncbi:MAG: hypothetical protein ACI85U_001631 [Candidatus Promineifilaceae bacterium]|jgi:hypothetical protein